MSRGVSVAASVSSPAVCGENRAPSHPRRRHGRQNSGTFLLGRRHGEYSFALSSHWPLGRSRCTPVRLFAYKSESGEDIPQAVVDAEEKSAGGRQYRMAAMGLFGGLAGALSLTRVVLNVLGTPAPIEFLRPSLLGELLDIIVIGTAGILWNSELSTKEANIQRIWEEVKRRREQSGPKFIGKDELRQRKKDKKGGRKAAKGFSQEMREMRREERREADAKSPYGEMPRQQTQEKSDNEAGRAGGLLSNIKAAYKSANSAGRVQALQVNDALEEAGLLKPLSSKDDETVEEEGSGKSEK